MTIADDERRAALAVLIQELKDFAEIEARVAKSFDALIKTQAMQAESIRRHVAELWAELRLKDRLHELYAIQAVLEK